MRSRITRLDVDGRTVIRKEPLGPDAQRRVQHESAILERLRGVAGVAQLVAVPAHAESITVEDVGDTSLAAVAKPLDVCDLIGLALNLARAVAGMHHRGVIHRDITPANIVISRDGSPCLVDFTLATSFAEIRPPFTHHTEIVGTLAYLAPEQTGRTGRSVDQRADLYALGATLYELATGAPPFGSGDPLRLTHDHLARVAVPPARVNPAVPGPLSEIIMHLLEKEPDDRYQTADGVLHDLELLRDAEPRDAAALRVGAYDVPLRLLPPSRLVGRDGEVSALRAAFRDALAGRCRGVLVGGAAGVGKTALVDELRPVVTGRDGWFVVGKVDQYRPDLEFDAVQQAFRALGRLLLAEPEDALAEVRGRILMAVGPNAGLLSAVLPEFAALLGVPPDAGDPLTAKVRVQRAVVRVLRAVASRQRPIVVFVDDLQWAGRTTLGVADEVLSEEPIEGLLLVCAYRDADVDAAHPMATPLSRWREQPGVRQLRLDNLAGPDLVSMVAEMLHVDPSRATGLAAAIGSHTRGNPYETVELLNALRRDGVLALAADGWHWDETEVRRRLRRSEVTGLPQARLEDMPARSRQVVEAMACLGGRAELSLLQAATGATADRVEQSLVPALDEGLLVVEPGVQEAVRFRHDQTREMVLRAMDPQRRRALRLSVARRLADVPELFAAAAEQYAAAIDAVDDPAEQRRVVGLLRRAAGQATLTGDHALVEALLTAALLIGPDETATLVEVHTARHAAMYGQGHLDEADEEYRTIEELCDGVLDRADATGVQVSSLTHRCRFAEATKLGVESLRELGVAVPAADRIPDDLDRQFAYLRWWLDHPETDDPARPEIADPLLLAAARLLNAVIAAAYFSGDYAAHCWLGLESLRIWVEHGPDPILIGPASIGCTAAVLRGDFSAGYRGSRRIVAQGEVRGYEPGTSQARAMLAAHSHWFEPAEEGVRACQRAREGLIAGGDLANAGYTYYQTASGLVDCGPTLDDLVAELDAGRAFVRRTGNEQTDQVLDSYRWLVGALRGKGPATMGDAYPADTPTPLPAHLTRGIAAAILDDPAGLARHSKAAMSVLTGLGPYPSDAAYLLRGLALAGEVRAGHDGGHDGLLSELDDVTGWLAARAADAPMNFLHMLRLLEAERAWAAGDFRAAALAFDAALDAVARHRHPWHRALITERAARFHLTNGLEHAGHGLMAEARQEYLAWGATAKVEQLDWAYPALRPQPERTAVPEPALPGDALYQRAAVTTGTLDLFGILSASQALSSETGIERLHSRVAHVLSAMTGATDVYLLLRGDDRQEWLRPLPGGEGIVPVTGAGDEPAAPMSVVRYAQRTREPLIVGDATSDDRFARDPYFAGVTCCSLLAVPILSRDTLQAILMLENRLIRGAFTTARLEAVRLIAGQLAVSLDNVQLYAEFRRIADEQTALRRVATLVARGTGPELVFAAVADEVGVLFDVDATAIVRFEPDDEVTMLGCHGLGDIRPGMRGRPDPRWAMATVRATGRAARRDVQDPASVASFPAAPVELRSSVASPIVVEGRLWGAVAAGSRRRRLPAETGQRLAGFTELVASAIANAESRTELTNSRARIVAAADHSRRRIERDLHDGAQQRLVSLALQVRTAQAALPPELDGIGAQLDRAATEATEALDELREISRGIHPAILTDGGLGPALRALARRSPVPVDLDIRTKERPPEQYEVSTYYVVAEALTNAAKHAHASAVTVTVETDATNATDATGTVLRVAVSDDGVGGADFARGTGLLGLKDRVEALGGRIRLDSPRGAGTRLRVEFPLAAA
ncbi:AAA family ATPase [Dactylosporangium sp. NPDC000555]|uniref:AAA family ATPase n=1 Tax=Dactylosporangium sp. NPDC000555 TaxID=3154260 RepID=UPI00333498F2